MRSVVAGVSMRQWSIVSIIYCLVVILVMDGLVGSTVSPLLAGTITGADIVDGSITEADLAPSVRNRITDLEKVTLEVVDVHNSLVGQLFTKDSVIVRLPQGPFVLPLTIKGFDTSRLYFPSLDCSGPPYVMGFTQFQQPSKFFRAVLVAPPGATLYGPVPNQPWPVLTLRSSLFSNSTEPDGICQQEQHPQTVKARPVEPIVDLGMFFTPPFRLRW